MDVNNGPNWLSDGTWLGRLHVANHLFADFEPVAELADGKWIKVENRVAKFPKQGYVRAKKGDLGQGRITGSLWVFGCAPSGMDRHQCIAVEPERAVPLVDLSRKSLAEARRQLIEVGIPLPEHQGRQAVVLLQDGTCCNVRFEPHGHLFVARLPADGIVEFRRADPVWMSAYQVGNTVFLPMRGTPSGEVLVQRDWSSDRDFLLKVVERYRAAVTGYWDLRGKASEPPIRKLERALAEGRLTGAAAPELDAIVDRMRTEWAETSRAFVSVQEMGELLLESEPGKRLLKEAVERRSDALTIGIETELRKEIEGSLASRREEFERLEREVERETSLRDGLRARIATLAQEEADAHDAVQKTKTVLQGLEVDTEDLLRKVEQLQAQKVAMQAMLDEDANRQKALATRVESLQIALIEFQRKAQREFEATGANDESALQALAARLERELGENGETVEPFLPSAIPPWWRSTSSSDVRCISKAELDERLAEEAESNGILAEDMHLVDLFARSGELVLLLGDQTEQVVCAYARTVSGGDVRTHALDPSTIGLDDLWRVPTTGRPTAFALAWHQAHVRRDAVVLLCLRDFDASPFHLWLASLAAVLRSPERPRNLLLVATIATVSERDEEYQGSGAFRHHLVAVEPRADFRAHLAQIVHDEPVGTPSRLNAPWELDPISQTAFRAIAQSGRNAEVVRRALRLYSVEGDAPSSHAGGLAYVWSQYLVDGLPDALPPALSSAHERLKLLHIQR